MPGKGNCEELGGEDLLGVFPCKLLFVEHPTTGTAAGLNYPCKK